MKIKNILFDLDGTIIEPSKGIINSVLYAFNKLEVGVPDKASLKKFIGPPLIDSFKEYGLDDNTANVAVDYYRVYFSEKGINENTLYKNIAKLLNDLHQKNLNLFIATSKPTVFAEQIIKSYKLENLFKQIVGSNLDNTRRKKEEIIAYVVSENQLLKDETIMIGDRHFDIIGAHKNDIKAIGVAYGHGSIEELKSAKADYILDTVEQLHKLLANNL